VVEDSKGRMPGSLEMDIFARSRRGILGRKCGKLQAESSPLAQASMQPLHQEFSMLDGSNMSDDSDPEWQPVPKLPISIAE